MADTIKQVTDRLSGSTRVIIYHKGERDRAGLAELLEYADEVVPLENIGREGETYLVSINWLPSPRFYCFVQAESPAPYRSSLQRRRKQFRRPYSLPPTTLSMALAPPTSGRIDTA
jgi:hypothetical protein